LKDTVGHALTDSPVGLMAYILEKYSVWTFGESIYDKEDGGLNSFEKDDLLTVVTLYWMSNTITSSIRFYKNSVVPRDSIRSIMETSHVPIQVPVAVQYFQNELFHMPYKVFKSVLPNLKQYSMLNYGGHFASFENPISLADDFIKFIKSC
jgi:microsomal epoxide hydrolase